MLQLIDIRKTYTTGDFHQVALDGISVSFRKNEFVAIVGPSGSGKTTTLNIIGGLDRYDSGDIIINGKSTKKFKDADWDAYRNQSIGFVFQNYNLISHISVLDNIEMGMTLSGLSAKERRKKALHVLEKVGLTDHQNKRPNQLSGGQMQRVAIARAIVNDPDIVMADEPTGALDSATSIQIMDLIKEVAKDKLVILVTHNKEIASRYANRTLHMIDGQIVEDTNPYVLNETEPLTYQMKKTAMSFRQALTLSFNNLKTKLSRALLTAFAGSIGIIGIGLVLSLSNGLNTEISAMESGMLADYPLMINSSAFIIAEAREMFMGGGKDEEDEFPSESTLFVYNSADSSPEHVNIFSDPFLQYLENMDPTLYDSIAFRRAIRMNLFAEDNGAVVAIQTSNLSWSEMPDNEVFVLENYDLLAGSYPTDQEDLVLVVDTYNGIDLDILTALGYPEDIATLGFDALLGQEFTLVSNDDYYQYAWGSGLYLPSFDFQTLVASPKSLKLSVTGILRPKADANATIMNAGIHYLSTLTDFVLEDAADSPVALAQIASDTSVLTGTALTSENKELILKVLGAVSTPVSISIYPVGFDAKTAIKAYIDTYNKDLVKDDQIIYTDAAEMITQTVGTLIDTVTYVLVAFSAISLVVSSIMIGIITYVSVLERTKEIGILRSLGARKKDIARVFDAETVLIGFASGLMGVGFAFALTFPVNIIIANLVEGVDNIASFSPWAMLSLTIISVALTFISGLIPASLAAKKDPVEALRTE